MLIWSYNSSNNLSCCSETPKLCSVWTGFGYVGKSGELGAENEGYQARDVDHAFFHSLYRRRCTAQMRLPCNGLPPNNVAA